MTPSRIDRRRTAAGGASALATVLLTLASESAHAQGLLAERLASGEQEPYDIVIAGTSLYWTAKGAGAVRKLSLGNSSPVTLVTPGGEPASLTVQRRVYWMNYGNQQVETAPQGGGNWATVAPAQVCQCGFASLTVHGQFAYWVETDPGTIMRAPRSGGTPVTLVSGETDPIAIAVDETSVYWLSYGPSGSVRKAAKDGGAAVTLAAGQDHPISIALDRDSIYWGTRNGGTIMKLAKAGGTPVPLATGQADFGCGGIVDITLDDTSVYWTADHDGRVAMVPKTGGSVVVLFSRGTRVCGGFQGIASDRTDIYWTDGVNGEVWRVSKP